MEAASQNVTFFIGACTQPEVKNFVQTWCFEDDIRNIEAIFERWQRASGIFREFEVTEKNISETIGVKEPDASLEEQIAHITSRPLYKRTFSDLPTEIKFVEIDKLISCQRILNLDYAEELKRKFAMDISDGRLLEICLQEHEKTPAPQALQVQHNSYSYSSFDTNFRFLGGYPKKISPDDIDAALDGGMPTASIALLFGHDFGPINAFSVGSRMILNNGFHRAYALRALGVRYIPVVVQKVNNADLEFPAYFHALPKAYLLQHPRPSMIRGFLNPDLCMQFKIKKGVSTYKITWNIEHIFAPAI